MTWAVFEETTVPGIPWAATSTGNSLFFTSGEGPNDDRYVRRYMPGKGFDASYREAVPEFTGSYLGESWHLARCLLTAETPSVQDVARVPFACRSLAFDGRAFWTNHRAQNETVAFSLPQ